MAEEWLRFCSLTFQVNSLNSTHAGGRMIFDFITYGLLASIFVVNTLRMFVDKPKKALQMAPLSWQRLLGRGPKSNDNASEL